jgi:hypothetical protein
VLSQGEVAAIFRTLPDMRDVMTKINGVVQVASEDDNVSNGVAQVANEFMVAKSALLEVFLAYARGHDSALRTLRAAQVRPEVSRSIDGIASSDERVRGDTLESLLEGPLALAMSLRGLLSALVGLCSPADRGYAALSDAMELMAAIVREAAAAGYAPAGNAGPAPSSPAKAYASGSLTSPARGDAKDFALATLASRPVVSSPSASASSSAVSAAMPLHPSTLGSELKGAEVSVDSVLAAQANADEAARRLAELERHVALKEEELSLAQREVVRAEEQARSRGKGGLNDPLANGSAPSPMDEALRKLKEEERDLFDRMRNSEHRAVFEAFLHRKQELEAEEARLSAALAEHEETLAQVRARLANPPASVLPADPAKASLYIAWKKALAEREELLRAARRRKHELLKDLKARHETQVVLLELERRSAVDSLKDAVQNERGKVEAYKRDLVSAARRSRAPLVHPSHDPPTLQVSLDESIDAARTSMKKFRQEFEQLRVALLIDRMAKSTQIANLADRRSRLAKEAESFQEAVEAARQRIAAEESAKWEARLQAAKEDGERRVAEERRAIEAKIDKVRQALAERFEAGFRPLLKEAETRHVAELQRVVELQRELENKEAELRAAHEAARSVSAASGTGLLLDESGNVVSSSSSGAAVDPVTGAPVPEWKLREFEDLKAAVASMWEQLDVPAEEVTAFLSEADLMAPYSPEGSYPTPPLPARPSRAHALLLPHSSPAVLDMYHDMYRRLSASASTSAYTSSYPLQSASLGAATQPTSPNGVNYGASARGTGYGSTPATAKQSVSPLPMSAARPTPAAAVSRNVSMSSAGSAQRMTPAAASSFRETGFSGRRDEDYGVKSKTLPPSLGGPGGRGNSSPPRRR